MTWTLPPDGAKDVRGWLTHPDRGWAPWTDRGRQLVERLLAGQADPSPVDDRSDLPVDPRPVIRITADEYVANDAAAAALARDPELYQRGGLLVRVMTDPVPAERAIRRPGGPRIAPVSQATLRGRLTRVAEWRKLSAGGNASQGPAEAAAHPPEWCVAAVADRGEWPGVPILEAVIDHPVLRPDRSILTSPGYDPVTGLLYRPPAGLAVDVPDHPASVAVQDARERLLGVVADFPFAARCHRSAWLAGLLTPLARFAFVGPAPLFLVEANTPGAGKGCWPTPSRPW